MEKDKDLRGSSIRAGQGASGWILRAATLGRLRAESPGFFPLASLET